MYFDILDAGPAGLVTFEKQDRRLQVRGLKEQDLATATLAGKLGHFVRFQRYLRKLLGLA